MNFEVEEITRDNLLDLLPLLRHPVDCVIFASNSLGDSKIYEYVCSEEFVTAFGQYLGAGGAALVLPRMP